MPKRPRKLVIGTDPGFRNFGYVVYEPARKTVVESGVFRTAGTQAKKRQVRKSAEDMACLGQLWRDLSSLLDRYKPVLVTAEIPIAGARTASATKSLAYATALASGIETLWDLPVIQHSPADVKVAMTGDKSASKNKMVEAAAAAFDISWPKTKGLHEHIADAAATIYASYNDPTWKALFNAR